MISKWKLDLRTMAVVSERLSQCTASSSYLSGLLFKDKDLVDGFLYIVLESVNVVAF